LGDDTDELKAQENLSLLFVGCIATVPGVGLKRAAKRINGRKDRLESAIHGHILNRESPSASSSLGLHRGFSAERDERWNDVRTPGESLRETQLSHLASPYP